MDLFDAIEKRVSIRKFQSTPFPEEYVKKAIEYAILAPNSSNIQTWDFYWVRSEEMKKKVSHLCLDQSAARTANQFLVITADPKKWKRSYHPINEFIKKVKAPKPVVFYYEKLIPVTYRWGFLNLLGLWKWCLAQSIGLFRPMMRGPNTKRDLQEVAIKSAALAAENFVLAITAQGGSTCMMEGFDEWRMKRLLNLPCSSRVVMVIGIGYEGERATWGPRFRLPVDEVLHIL